MNTVLLVEDNPNQQNLYTQELQDEGYEVFVAADGKIALDLIQSGEVKPDVVVLDLQMPGKPKDGMDTLDAIMAHNRNIPIIKHTAYSFHKDNFMTWAAVDYIIKSSDLTVLKRSIKRVLEE